MSNKTNKSCLIKLFFSHFNTGDPQSLRDKRLKSTGIDALVIPEAVGCAISLQLFCLLMHYNNNVNFIYFSKAQVS